MQAASLPAFFQQSPYWALLAECLVAMTVGLVLHAILFRLARRLSAQSTMASSLTRYTARASQILIPLLFVQVSLSDADPAVPKVQHWVGIATILMVTILIIRLIQAVSHVIEQSYPVTMASNLQARQIQTKTRVLCRTAMFIVGMLGLSSVLMTFPAAKQMGSSLLASAGVAGIVAGLAARATLGNLLAGIQIALTQPIRLDDVLIVENEWGRVEELTLTYVVIRIWDDRRLIVPLTYFIEQPFQNWTRTTSDLIGSVFLWVDYRMPIEPLREEMRRICEATPLWDQRVCVLQVTDATDHAIQLRGLVSSVDAGQGWDLRCHVREALVAFMRQHYPAFLPQTRMLWSEASKGI